MVRQKGFTCAHVALSKSLKEIPCTPGALTPGYALYLRHLFEQNGIDIAVLGNYLNLAHPDEDALHAIQEKYYAHIRFASLLGCGMVGTETGAPNAEYKFCPECRSDAALSTFIKNFKPVVRCAEQYGVTIAIEPVVKHIVYDAKRARTVLDEIGSPNLQILFDPVNLLNMENVDRREESFCRSHRAAGQGHCHDPLQGFPAQGRRRAAGRHWCRAGRHGRLPHHPAVCQAGKALHLRHAGKHHPGKLRGLSELSETAVRRVLRMQKPCAVRRRAFV